MTTHMYIHVNKTLQCTKEGNRKKERNQTYVYINIRVYVHNHSTFKKSPIKGTSISLFSICMCLGMLSGCPKRIIPVTEIPIHPACTCRVLLLHTHPPCMQSYCYIPIHPAYRVLLFNLTERCDYIAHCALWRSMCTVVFYIYK